MGPTRGIRRLVVVLCLSFSITGAAHAVGRPNRKIAFPDTGRSFPFRSGIAQPADFQSMHIAYEFNASAKTAVGRATITFTSHEEGFPYFILYAEVKGAKLDGLPVNIDHARPNTSTTEFSVIDRGVDAGTSHILEIGFKIGDDNVSFKNGGVGFLTAMGDLQTGHFFEDYGPASYEDDQFKLTVNLSIKRSKKRHLLFTNGQASHFTPSTWKIEFPDYFSSTLFYFHLTNQALSVQTGVYKGLEREIPFTVYSSNANQALEGASILPGLFAEMENTFGPYHHASYTAYISGRGGMEHAGAAITSISALDHELLHSWFARGVVPSDGRSGWIDEGIASWRDNSYFTSAWPPSRNPAILADFSAFERFTPKNSYRDGRQLMSELDGLLTFQGGLRPVLKNFFATWKGKNITTQIFKEYLEDALGIDLGPVFARYVYGVGNSMQGVVEPQFRMTNKHPPALTREEILELR